MKTGADDQAHLERRLAELRAELSDPATPPSRIAVAVPEVYQHLDTLHAVDTEWAHFAELVAAHPNTPLNLLKKTVERFPHGLSRNPVLPLLPLQAPDFLPSLDQRVRLVLLAHPGLSGSVLASLVDLAHSAAPEWEVPVSDAVRWYIATAGEAGRDWEKELRGRLRRLAAKLPVALRAGDAYWFLVPELATFGLFPDWLVPGLLQHFSFDTSGPLHEWSPLTQEYLSDLSDAQNPATPPVRLEHLARYGSFLARRAVVGNPASPDGVLAQAQEVAVDRLRERLRRSPSFGCLSLVRLTVALSPFHPTPLHLPACAADSPVDRLTDALTLPLPARADDVTRLADDGDRHVRAAARARLADPDYRFTL